MKRQVKTQAFIFKLLLLIQNISAYVILNMANIIATYVVFLVSKSTTYLNQGNAHTAQILLHLSVLMYSIKNSANSSI